MKRTIAIVLCVVLLLAVLPGAVSAETESVSSYKSVAQQAAEIYKKCQVSAKTETFQGCCGLMVSHQLYHMGINSWAETYDGNKQYDAYAAKEITSGGYYVTAYSAEKYTISQALNAITKNGTEDVYNILVGFETTTTEAGALYGHACVINAILGGTVYFVESFPTGIGGAEGNVITCSIAEFEQFYADWTTFEGLIHFTRDYADGCQKFGTDVFVRTRFASTLRSQPCLIGEHECTRIRSISGGEQLRANALCKNSRGELYYQIVEGEQIGYVAANAVTVTRLNPEDITLVDWEVPQTVVSGATLRLSGTVLATNSSVSSVEITVTDVSGEVALRARREVDAMRFELKDINNQMGFGSLAEGNYLITVTAKASCVVARGTGLRAQFAQTTLMEQWVQIGGKAAQSGAKIAGAMELRDGWLWENGQWYCYDNGQPCSGWVQDLGVSYYLNEDGSVTTGWAEIDGKTLYFSPTGALCKGWLTTPEGVYYCQADGTAYTGLLKRDGKLYYFDDQGVLVTGGTVTVEDVTYKISSDGTATEK